MLYDGDNAKDNLKVQLYTMYQPIFKMRGRKEHCTSVLSLFHDFLVYPGFLVWIPKRVQARMR